MYKRSRIFLLELLNLDAHQPIFYTNVYSAKNMANYIIAHIKNFKKSICYLSLYEVAK